MLLRGLELLAALNRRQVARIQSLANDTGLPKATLVRMLRILEQAGYVRRLPHRRGYSVEARVLTLSAGYRAAEAVVTQARPLLEAFTRTYGWPVAIGTRDRDMIRVRDETLSASPLSRSGDEVFIGRRVPMLVSALGRAYIAFCPEAEQRELLERLAADEMTAAVALIDEVRATGYALNGQRKGDQAFGLGLPIRCGGGVLASVCIRFLGQGPKPRADMARRYLEPLRDLAGAIEAGVEKASLVGPR